MEEETDFYIGYDFHLCYEFNNVSKTLRRTSSTICTLLYIFLGLLSVITVCGNLVVIISIIYFKQLHTPSNYLIISLAVTDLLVGFIVFPLSMSFSFSSCLYYRDLFCKIRDSFDVILSTTSIFNLCCISVDRYHAVCQPLMYKSKINTSVVLVMILMSWGVPVLVAIGFIVAELNQEKCQENCLSNVVLEKAQHHKHNPIGFIVEKLNQKKCQENCFSDVVFEKALVPLITFYLPVIIMLYIYLKIFLVAQRQAHSIQNAAKSGVTVSNMERKATKTLAIVMGVFIMCWLPFFLCFSFQLLGGVSVMMYETLNWLTLSNSMFNPFIYVFFYSWFRPAFRILISGKIFQEDLTNTKLL